MISILFRVIWWRILFHRLVPPSHFLGVILRKAIVTCQWTSIWVSIFYFSWVAKCKSLPATAGLFNALTNKFQHHFLLRSVGLVIAYHSIYQVNYVHSSIIDMYEIWLWYGHILFITGISLRWLHLEMRAII